MLALDAITPRYDLYVAPHKMLRMFMSDTQLRVGALDTEDAARAQPALDQLRDLLAMLHHHLEIEDTFVLSALEVRRPGAGQANSREHRDHERAIAELGDLATQVERAIAAAAPERVFLAHRLYLALGRFVADNLEHMDVEETHMNPVLWALFSDEELRQIQADILGWLTPAQKAVSVRWMIPSLSPAERATWASDARRAMPDAAFAQLIAYACALLPPADATRLRDAVAA
jgi:hemerythrin-like domain-containing protein